MHDSLLVALRSYRARASRDSLEDFITAAFAWTLQQMPAVGEAVLHAIYAETEGSHPVEDIDWRTHVHLETNDGRGEADMVAYHNGQAVLFEHKTYSPATAAQIDRYRRAIPTDVAATALITASRWNYTGPQSPDVDAPDVHWTWGDVHEIMSEAASEVEDPSRVDDFLALLDHEGLGPSETITEPRLRAFSAAQGVKDELFALVEAVRTQSDWRFVYNRLPSLEDTPEQPERWTSVGNLFHGRIPFDLFQSWRPGLRTGIIVDPSNIRTKLVDKTLGPDLAIYLGIPKDNLGSNRHQQVMKSSALHDLSKRLRQSAPAGWSLTGQPDSARPQGHHPVVLQRPLAPVIRGIADRNKQRDAVYEALRPAITAFLEGDEMHRLRDQLTRLLGTDEV